MIRKRESTGLEIQVRGSRLILISRKGGYQELDITPVYHFLKEFFVGKWKEKWENIKKSLPKL